MTTHGQSTQATVWTIGHTASVAYSLLAIATLSLATWVTAGLNGYLKVEEWAFWCFASSLVSFIIYTNGPWLPSRQ